MPTFTPRRIFSGRITIPPNQGTSLYELMRDSSLHWGFTSTALTTPSPCDSIIGSEIGLVPDGEIFIGSNSSVNATTQRGVRVAGGANYSLQDFGPVGMLDPNQIWIYSVSGGGADVTFQAR